MDKYLRPERFNVAPASSDAARAWEHWKRTFESFLAAQPDNGTTQFGDNAKLQLLINYVSPSIFTYISECQFYDTAMNLLSRIYVKPSNVVYARHVLATRKQHYATEMRT